MRRLAAVDIGSNTVHALVADWDGYRLTDVSAHVEMPALGREVARTGKAAGAARRVVGALRRVVAAARADGAEVLIAGATEAVRRASDRESLLARASEAIGEPVRLIAPEREAHLSFLGASEGHAVKGDWLLCDLGGGSTEIVAGHGRKVVASATLRLGSGVLAAEYLSDPPAPGERSRLREVALRALSSGPECEAERLVATGGTAANLPRLLRTRAEEELGIAALLEAVRRVDSGPAAEIARRHRLPADRIVAMRAGVEVLLAILDWAGLDRLTPTHRGLRHGMLLAYIELGDDWWR